MLEFIVLLVILVGVSASPVNPRGQYKDPLLKIFLDHQKNSNGNDIDVSSYTDIERLLDSKPLTEEDFKRAENITDIVGDDSSLYSPEYFEGDIVESLKPRNAMTDLSQRWANNRVPYLLANKFSDKERAVIAAAMRTYHDRTCIKFEPKTSKDRDYLYIYPGLGCASQVGRMGGGQPFLLGRGCVYQGIVEHELMHAVGFWHEQSRADRDKYVRINWQNIQRGMAYNFDKLSLNQVQHLNEEYDYGSVMHYGSTAFTNGKGPTIVPLKSGTEIGQRRGLSKVDLRKINKLYECSGKTVVHKLRIRTKNGK
ncbi:hatching enzyme 1.2-like [Brevipalpus obovatus]|uniref:hatching enzyme 1.2-like n=1 Tax=Brevipalpus obovatus TaxID=246614 RepID=UPI003D9E18B6